MLETWLEKRVVRKVARKLATSEPFVYILYQHVQLGNINTVEGCS